MNQDTAPSSTTGAFARPPSPRLPRRRRVLFAALAVAIAGLGSLTALLAVDVYLHSKFARSAGFNIWGYRGRIARRKQSHEYRIVMVGGSTTYGYGNLADEAIPAVLERGLRGRTIGPYREFSVVNLGYNNEGAYSFRFTLDDYRYLQYDLAILYEGYNDLTADSRNPNLSVFRHESPVFRWTGYLPIFPLVFKEKAIAMMNASAAARSPDQPKTVFSANQGTKTAEILKRAIAVGESLERELERVAAEPKQSIGDPESTGCKSPWEFYCRSIAVAVDYALQNGRQVIVGTQPYGAGPYFRQRHSEQQSQMAAMLERTFPGNPRLRYVNLGDVVDLNDQNLSFDRMHLTPRGNQIIAAAFEQPVLEMAAQREQHGQ